MDYIPHYQSDIVSSTDNEEYKMILYLFGLGKLPRVESEVDLDAETRKWVL